MAYEKQALPTSLLRLVRQYGPKLNKFIPSARTATRAVPAAYGAYKGYQTSTEDSGVLGTAARTIGGAGVGLNLGLLPTWLLLNKASPAAPAKTAAQQSLESIYNNKETVKKYEATESVMKPKVVSESHGKLTPTRAESSKKGPAHTYEAGESFMKYSAVIPKLSPRHFGKFVKLAMHDEKAAANWLHSVGDSLDAAGEGIYNAGAAVNRGIRNAGNSAYNWGQSMKRIPGQLWAGVTGGLGDHEDVMGSGDYGKGPPKPPAPTGVTRPTGGAYTQPQPAAPPRPAAPPAAAAPQPAAPPAGAPPQPGGGLPRQIPQPAMLKVPPQPAAPAPRADSTTAARPPQRAPGWNYRPGQK